MGNRTCLYAVACGLVMAAGGWTPAGRGQEALSTAFSYQGQLKLGGAPVNGPCDVRFRLWDAETGGLQVGSTQEQLALPVAGGLFAVALDFGAVFGDRQLWLETEVAHPAGSGAWATLAPRQALLAAPQAVFALGTPWSGLVGRPALVSSLDGVTSDLGNIDLVAGPNITIEPDPGSRRITISATGAAVGGDITAVLAGTGLAGGSESGDASLALAATYLDGSAFDTRFVNEGQAGAVTGAMLADSSVSLGKLVPGVLDWANLSGVPADLADGDQDTTYAAGAGLALTGTTFRVDFTTVSSTAHKHSGEQIVSGTVGEAYIDGALARDSEVPGLVLAADGAGSGLDADRLDGQDSTAFAEAGHAHTAAAVSVLDEFTHSDGTTVQDVLDDLDAAISAGGGVQNLFETVATPDGALLVADSVNDLLTVAAGPGIEVTGDGATDTLTIGLAGGYADGSAFDGRFVNEGQAGSIGDAMIAGVAWGKLTGVPADLADGDQNTTYSAGAGLALTGTVFSLDFATVAAAVHTHAGEAITSGTVAEARLDGALARDSEVPGLVLAADGAGSGLDADLLDGQHATGFATAAHFHDDRYYTEAESTALFAALAHAHDERYYTETELSTSGAGGLVHWGNLSGIPAGFADGVDDDSGGDVTGVTAGGGLTGGGDSGALTLHVGAGTGISVAADTVSLAAAYADGSVHDARFVNEGQADAVTAAMIAPEVVSSIDGVHNDGGDIDLLAGSGITITPDDANHRITIAVTPAGASCWSLTGNAGTDPATQFIGTTDNKALEVRVNDQRALRLEPDAASPNLVGGYSGNYATAGAKGATIGGGGASSNINRVTDDYGTVAGGYGNGAGDNAGSTGDRGYAAVGGGMDNYAAGPYSFVGGGTGNRATGNGSTVAGGGGNQASNEYAAVAGGTGNTASGYAATVAGGVSNTASGSYSFAAGFRATVVNNGSFVWADATDADFTSGALNEFAVRAGGGMRVMASNANYGAYVDNRPAADGGDGLRVYAKASKGNEWGAVYAVNQGTSPALYASNTSGGRAAFLNGDVHVNGTLTKAGGAFRIDHPLEPETKTLSHSFVESPDMMNVYNGNVVLDDRGEAWVELPAWFEALNRDFRYQLTAIGGPGPNLHVADEIKGNRFRIAGGAPGLKVSWQVTGIRQDPYANAHRIPVEEDKPAAEAGAYLHPDAYGKPAKTATK